MGIQRKRIRQGRFGDMGRLSIAQDIFRKSSDFLRRTIAPASGVGGRTCHTSARTVFVFRLRITSGGCRRTTQTRNSVVGGVRLVTAKTIGDLPTGYG